MPHWNSLQSYFDLQQAAGKKNMSTSSATYLTIFLKPENEEHALYLMSESLTPTSFKVVTTLEELVTWGTVFPLLQKEKHLILELSAPIASELIEEIANFVATGLILGFVIRGEIDLGEEVINNLA